jgi:hypothetical protein
MFVIVELFRGAGKGKENDSVNNIEMHYICTGSGYNNMY